RGYGPLMPCNHIQNITSLPDMMPRCLLRHPLFWSYLATQLPRIPFPMATNLHPSLANLDHLNAIINSAINAQYPNSTGWNGET
ncbi:hypothetical protein ARMGADRAFT_945674, partial [Armillaria gallica]